MNVSPEEAQEALSTIQLTLVKTRKSYGYNGYYLITWGLIWFVGFLANQYLPNGPLGWIWGGLSTIGWVLSAALGIYQSRHVRSTMNSRVGFFYLALFVFAVLWFVILEPLTVKQGVLFFITLILFGGIVAGVFVRSISTIIGCGGITILALIGYYLLPAYFYVWMAIFGGLTMVGIGAVIRLRWR